MEYVKNKVKKKTRWTKATRREIGNTGTYIYFLQGEWRSAEEANQYWGGKGGEFGKLGANHGSKGGLLGSLGAGYGESGKIHGTKGAAGGYKGKVDGEKSKQILITADGVPLGLYGSDGGQPSHNKHKGLDKKTKNELRHQPGNKKEQLKRFKALKKQQLGAAARGKGNVKMQKIRARERKKEADRNSAKSTDNAAKSTDSAAKSTVNAELLIL